MHNYHNGDAPEVKPISELSQFSLKETEVRALALLDPEFPELLPGVLEKVRPYTGTKYWGPALYEYYTGAALEHFKAHPNALIPLPASDECLRHLAQMEIGRSRYAKARERYGDAFALDPEIAYLREHWASANREFCTYPSTWKKERLAATESRFRHLLGKDIEAFIEILRQESPEYKAGVEAARLREEALEAERARRNAIWEENRRDRRLSDLALPQWQRRRAVDKALLCAAAEDYAFEFFGQFFSEEYTGWPVEYDPVWRGYRFPKEAGEISEFLFSETGALFRNNGEGKGEQIREWDYVMTYGHDVLGYPLNSLDRFRPDHYSRALHGFAAWLKREKEKREGTFFEPGSFAYWEAVFVHVTSALFAGKLDENDSCTLRDSPRNLYRAVREYVDRELISSFPELGCEAEFKKFLADCEEGGKLRQRSLGYFKLTKSGRSHERKFELVFNPACIPVPEPTEEELRQAAEHCMELMSNSPLASKVSGDDFFFPPEEDYFEGDENARAEYEQESVD
jgi:hypothetical protein